MTITKKHALAAVAAGALAAPAAAQAHVTAFPESLPAEGYAKVDLRVPHGCDGSPTTKVTVLMPDEIVAATPQVVPGWKLSVKEGKLARPYDAHGEKVTEGVREVTWTGGPLPDPYLQEFGLSIRVAGEPGRKIALKTLQECKKGETAWAEIPVDGEEEPEAPAPMVALTAAQDADGEASDEAEATGTEEASFEQASAAGGDDTGAPTWLAILGVVLGALGLAAGAAGLAAARRARP